MRAPTGGRRFLLLALLRLWEPLGLFWGPLGLFGGRLGRLLGHLGAILRASWAVLERREAQIARTPKTFKNQWKSNDFCFLGPSWEASWRPLGASWRPLGPSGGHLGRPGAIFRRLLVLFDRLDGPPRRPLARFGTLVGEGTVPGANAGNFPRAQPRPAAPGNLGVWAPKKLQFWTSRGCMSLGALHFVPRARWRICEEGT